MSGTVEPFGSGNTYRYNSPNMTDPQFEAWVTNWDAEAALRRITDATIIGAVVQVGKALWAGAATGGAAIAIAAGEGATFGLATGASKEFLDVIHGTADGRYVWEQQTRTPGVPSHPINQFVSTDSMRPIPVQHNNDGSNTYGVTLLDGTTIRFNDTTHAVSTTGSAKADNMVGTNANETFNGGAGNDVIHAGKGGDTINGGAGIDIIWGGQGADIFRFTKTVDDRDLVHFDPARDWIANGDEFHISRYLFDEDASGVRRVTDIYLTGGNHLVLERDGGGDGRLGIGREDYTAAELEAVIRHNPVHDFFDHT